MVAPEWLFLSGDMGAVMDGFVGAPVPAERVDPSICVLNDDDRKRIGLIWISGTMSDRIVPTKTVRSSALLSQTSPEKVFRYSADLPLIFLCPGIPLN